MSCGRQPFPVSSGIVEPILDVRDLSVRFGSTTVLRNLSFNVERGDSLAVLGPNAAGKTVLFRALVGAIRFEGTVRWAPGTRLGYVPQTLDLERDIPMSGLDFLRARAALVPGRGNAASTIGRTLALVGVTREAAGHTIGTLSGGQFQRLLIAFALVGEPDVLLLDEPMAGIDAPGQEHLTALVRRLQAEQGLTVLFISHELSVVYRSASRVLCLNRERICLGPPRSVLTPDLLHEVYGTPVDYHVHDD